MDMLDLKFDDRQFDVVLDKGAMDALVVSARVSCVHHITSFDRCISGTGERH